MGEAEILRIYKEIVLMYNTIKDIINNFYVIIGLVLAIIGVVAGVGIYLSKKWIEKAIDIEAKKQMVNLLSSVSKHKVVSGKQVLDDAMLVGKIYEFPVLEDITFKLDLWNKVILSPIKGNKQLKYKCEIKNGRLLIDFENFVYTEDRGVNWTIIYYPDMVKYLS